MSNDSVYIYMGRKCGKTMTQARQIEELMKSGKKVVLIEPKLTSQIKGFTCAGAIVDLDILNSERMERAEKMLNMILKGDQNESL